MTSDLNPLTHERLLAELDYNPDTGVFVWKSRGGKGRRPDGVAGTRHSAGYTHICLRRNGVGGFHFAHRLAWFYVHGCWPKGVIDHINGDRTDNRIANLRDVPVGVNAQNRRAPQTNSRSGVLGVCWKACRSRWLAQIKTNGQRTKVLGTFRTKEEAEAAYLAAKRELHEGCTI
jgi:hypothetical protein